MNYKKYDTGGNVEEEKEYSPAKSWAMARAKLGIAGSQEEQDLKRAQKLWTNYLSDIQDSRLQAFKDRNLYSTIGSKLLGGAGYLLGGADMFKDMKWLQPTLTTLGATAGRYAGTLAADPNADEYQPKYADFAKDLESKGISNIEEGRFFSSTVGLEQDITDSMVEKPPGISKPPITIRQVQNRRPDNIPSDWKLKGDRRLAHQPLGGTP